MKTTQDSTPYRYTKTIVYSPAQFVALLTDRASVERCANYEADHARLHEYFNAWTPGMSKAEANKKSGFFSFTLAYGACAPVLRCSDFETDETLSKLGEEFGFVDVGGTSSELADAATKRLAEMDEKGATP